MKEIRIAKNAGFCFGVKRAVEIANNEKNKRTYTLGPLIHNDDLVNKLKESNIYSIEEDDINELQSTDSVVIRSHGVTAEVHQKLKSSNARIVDATCPYVLSIHKKVMRYFKEGYQIIIVGDKNHPEVIGINGWCNNTAIITKTGDDLTYISDKVCVVAQTTEQLINYDKVVEKVKLKNIEFIAFNTICNATKERQESAEELSKTVDLMIVIGGKKSSNSRKLYEICKANCSNSIFIENKEALPIEIIKNDKNQIIGITAGASTPDWVTNEVVEKIQSIDKDL